MTTFALEHSIIISLQMPSFDGIESSRSGRCALLSVTASILIEARGTYMWFLGGKDRTVSPQPGPWETAVPLQVEQVATSLAMREIRSLLIDNYLSSKTFSSGVHVGNRIREDIENRIRESMNIPKSDIIKVVFDGTYFGLVKNGFVISVDGLYWKEFWGTPQFTNWQALSIAQSRRRISFKSSEVIVENAKISMTFGTYSVKDLENVITGILRSFH